MSGNYAEEIPLLKKLLKTTAFRFVIIRYNHYSIVTKIQEDLKTLFPEKPSINIDGETTNFKNLFEVYQNLDGGILYLENFETLLRDQTRSTGEPSEAMKVENARRHAITSMLNLRRDKLAKIPNALIVFIASSAEERFMKIMMEKMPDLWSFRSLFLDIEEKIKPTGIGRSATTETSRGLSTPSITTNKNAAEIRKLEQSLRATKEDEVALKLTIYPQLTDLLFKDGIYDKAIIYFDEWLEHAEEKNRSGILVDKGDAQITKGELIPAKETFNLSLLLAKKYKQKNKEGICYSFLGDIQKDLGDLEGAMNLYEKYQQELIELTDQFPDIPLYKSNLAISYSKLGSTHYSMGKLDKALKFFQERSRLGKELYEAYPNNVSFKNGLAISYEKLGKTHSSMGKLDKALKFFQDETVLFEELYEAYPNNVSFKNGLAISYEKLGETHSSMGKLDKALKFFQERSRLSKELYETYPNNVSFKNGLAISYEKLGKTHSSMGKLDKALKFFQDETVLFEELYEAYPNNVSFKNGLAVSYFKLGETYERLKQTEAKNFFLRCHVLLKELSDTFPTFLKFQENFKEVEEKLQNYK